MKNVEMCKGQGPFSMIFSNATTFYNNNHELRFEMTIDLAREVSNDLSEAKKYSFNHSLIRLFMQRNRQTEVNSFFFQIAFDFMKCDASGNPDSCEYVIKNFAKKDICKYVAMKNQVWSIFVDYVHPPLACPIKPAMYQLLDSPVNANILKTLPIGDALWKVTLRGYDNDIFISCVNLEVQIVPNLKGGRNG
ncbi:hypothetical protein NQ315_016890 [Exocentrus adspersus]|uniref:Uncharacterized protein n=1 Tax=Exocentrus adspersus TaxID=1586481 RepID=A0AAV8VZE5_9CUCU|nr:hypothetical protein NQ315_016890 [Exocentrus adspersus]